MPMMADDRRDPAGLREFYRRSDAYQRQLAAKNEQYFAAYVSFVAKYVPAGSAVLDLGCGSSVSTECLARAGFRAAGCDLRIPETSSRQSVVALCEGDGLSLPFRDGTFDAVAASSYLEHVPNPGAALAEMVRVCRIGGRVLIDGPNHLSPIHPAKTIVSRLVRPGSALPTPFGNTVPSIASTSVRLFCWACQKMLTRRCRFIPRQPDLGHPELGGDLDALWWSNPVDIRFWFREQGHRVVASQTEGRTRWLGDLASGAQVVAERIR